MNSRHILRYIVTLLIIIFWISKPAELIWDDELLIGLNPWTEDPSNIMNIWHWTLWQDIPGEHASHWYRPLMALHLIFDQQVFSDALLPRQIISLAWFLALSALVWKYLGRWTLSPIGRQLGFLVFVFHPFQLELIHFLAARNDMMVLVFALSGILARGKVPKLLFFLLAFLSKENAVLLCPCLIIGEYLNQKEWKDSATFFALSAFLYVAWKLNLDLPTYIPEIENIFLITGQILRNIFFPWDTATASFAYQSMSIFNWLLILPLIYIRHWAQDQRLYFFALGFVLLFLIIGGLASISSQSLSYRYATLPILGLSLLLGNLPFERLAPAKQQVTLLSILGFLILGFQNTRSQWQDSTSLWTFAHERTPSAQSACGLFMQVKETPGTALPLLVEAVTTKPVAQHCCWSATQYPLNHASPAQAITLGNQALNQGCIASPELIAPLGLSYALVGNWAQAKGIAEGLGTDPYGYSAVILVAEGLRNGDQTALDFWSTGDAEKKEELRAKAEQILGISAGK